MKHRIITATTEGMVPSQPGVGCAVRHTHGTSVYSLHVYRHYDTLPNRFGGHGRFRHLDADGMEFPSEDAAWAYALDHGYIHVYITDPWLRNKRVAEARDPRKMRKPTWMEVAAA